jgi:membrane dipeptidase
MRRRTMVAGLGAAVFSSRVYADQPAAEAMGFKPDPAFLEKAVALLKHHAAIDSHAHPGRTFARSIAPNAPAAEASAFEATAVGDMRAGLVAAASFAAVADAGVLKLTAAGIVSDRDYAPGEAARLYHRQTDDLHAVALKLALPIIKTPADLERCVGGALPGMIITVEGGDFLEGDVARLRAARDQDDVRIVTLVHYRLNELADNQTSPTRYGGLSPAGSRVVKEMARLGLVIDMAHASEPAVMAAINQAGVPLLCSHTHIKTAVFDHPRFISKDTARAIADAGGVVGSWPSGLGGVTLSDFVDRIFALTEVVGPAHVALGTDMDANYRPTMTSYRQLPLVVSELLRRGYGEGNVVGLVGGNFRKLFATCWQARRA